MVQQNVAGTTVRRQEDFRLPYRSQNAQNLSVIVGCAGAVVTALACVFGVLAARWDPGLAWLGALSVASGYALTMAVLWFATADELR